MSSNLSASRISHVLLVSGNEGSDLVVQAAGSLPGIPDEAGPSPAAANRAETLFESMGMGLMLLILLSAIWILIRKRL
jgi:hypothetical protein